MERFLLAAMLCGCGRLGFDAGDDARDAATCVPNGHDDDADGIDEPCDVCPHFSDDQTDTDSDGVGDACDPSGLPDRIAMFDGFLGSSLDPRWTPVGTITVGGSVVVLPAAAGLADLIETSSPDNTELAVRGEITTIMPGPLQLSLVFGDVTTRPGDGSEYCEVVDSGGGPNLQIVRMDSGSFSPIGAQTPISLAVGPFTFRYRHTEDGFACAFTSSGTTYAASGPGTYMLPRVQVALQVQGLDVSIESAARIERR